MARRERESYVIRSVAHTLDVLEQFSKPDSEELGVTELSRRLGLHKNNIFRILATLETRGYVEKNKSTENYRLSVKSLELGKNYVNRLGLLGQAKPVLEQLVREIRETAHIGVVRGGEVLYVDSVESPFTVRAISRIGYRVPAYCTAAGKAQIAFDTEFELLQRFSRGLHPCTSNTLIDLERLKADLREVRLRGYAFDNEEFEEGLRCIGAPVRDSTHKVIAALSIAVPASRLPEKRVSEFAEHVVEAADRLSQRLGYTWSPPAFKKVAC